jgi:membrane fusion protein, multidrug efflux system
MNSAHRWPAIFAGLATAALAGVGAHAQTPNLPGEGGARMSFGVMSELRAQLMPRQFTTLSSEMAGQIEAINTRVGERFRKGELLVVFDCAVQRAQTARARAELTKATKTLEINQRLLQLKSVGQLELDVARADVDKAKADLAVADAAVSKCKIEAPFSGITVEQKARAFQYATPGQALIDIIDTERQEVELIAPSRWLPWLKPGHLFEVQVDETAKVYPVRVIRLGGRVDPVSQSIKVIGEITDPAPELMAGMSGKASIRPPQ